MFVAGEGRGGERVTKREGDPERDPLQRYFSHEMLGLAGVSQAISLLTAMRPSQSSTAFFAVTPASRPSTPTAAVRGIWPSLGLGGASVAYGALAARGIGARSSWPRTGSWRYLDRGRRCSQKTGLYLRYRLSPRELPRLLTSKRFAGSALACEQLLPGKM